MTSPPAPPGVVIHLNDADPDHHQAVLRNINNLRAELGEDTPPNWSPTAPDSTSAGH
ncbi:hypothetical protein [Micromonospora chalcea]|uniref:hypothetical protein n=1 Tax=Micromonospora chalcea TaxID=1874 RepID=UPI0038258B76